MNKMINGEQLIKLMISYSNSFPNIGGKFEGMKDGMEWMIKYTQTFIRDMSGGFKGDSMDDWFGLSEEEDNEILENVPQWGRDIEELKTIKN